ncbi:MAG: hypothetical protein DWQ35_19910 [Planctomycetota bacterium]|nr:MAG: hypothetical protein DWQ35_19910 [Planctomycetota bacterium]REK28411.1 MAG: hypothetical protein DWQ42_05390 [Planctomycetota bacterium]REK48427.1 MAG: hypothetical protein DWQ46_02540 [Planctomycetota bacterium]
MVSDEFPIWETCLLQMSDSKTIDFFVVTLSKEVPRSFRDENDARSYWKCEHQGGIIGPCNLVELRFPADEVVKARRYTLWEDQRHHDFGESHGSGYLLVYSVTSEALNRIAYHEAGHLVTGCLLSHGQPIHDSGFECSELRYDHVSILPRPEVGSNDWAIGYCEDRSQRSIPAALESDDDFKREAVICCAGEAAEEIVFQGSTVSHGDRRNLEILKQCAGHDVEPSYFDEGARNDAEVFLGDHRLTLDEIARLLLDRHVLRSDEILVAMRR